MPEVRRVAMLPAPQKVTLRASASSRAMAAAAPRVARMPACARARMSHGASNGASANAARQACAAVSASGPWPRPSTTSTLARPSRCTSAQSSPHRVSPIAGTDTAP